MHERHEEIPFIPPQVDMADVENSGGRLIPASEVDDIKNRITAISHEDGRYSKKDLGTRYSITKIGGQYFAIYKGEKHGKVIGKGTFGSVKLVQNIDDGTWAVMKTIRKKETSSVEAHNKTVEKEKESLEKVRHFIGHLQRTSVKKNVLQDEIIMTLAPGTTIKRIIKNRNLPPVKWLDLAISMMQATRLMHQHGIVHRDIKPANMLADTTNNVVTLIDFGLSRKMNPATHSYKSSYAGTEDYMAPEINKHGAKNLIFNEATEVYALGISLLNMFKLHRVYHKAEKTVESVQCINNVYLLEELCNLINRMIHRNPAKRPSLHTIIEKLRELRGEELDLVSKLSSLVYLNVNDYIKLNAKQKESLFAGLRNADEVQLCLSPNPWAQELLMTIRHECEMHGASVSPAILTLLHANNQAETIDQLKQNTVKHGQRNNMIYNSFYWNLSADMHDDFSYFLTRSIDSLEISDAHKKIAMTNIENQISRMHAKNPTDTRLQFLREFRYKLQQGLIKTYRQLFSELRELEQRLIANETPSFTRKISRTFGISSNAAAAVRQTTSAIIDDAHGRKSPVKK